MPPSFQEKFEQAATLSDLTQDQTRQALQTYQQLEPVQRARLNPVAFARETGLTVERSIDLFVHGVRFGLFEFGWDSVCPLCGAITCNHEKLDALPEEHFYCAFCDQDASTTLDETIEVTFSPHPAQGETPFNPHQNLDEHLRYYTSSGFQLWDHIQSYQGRNTHAHRLLKPGERGTLTFDATPGELYRLVCFDTHSSVTLSITQQGATSPHTLSIQLDDQGFSPLPEPVPAGTVTLTLLNRSASTNWIRLIQIHPDELQDFIQNRVEPVFEERLTASMLLSNQTFREVYDIGQLIPDLKLKIRHLTVLFTDLKGSTDLYERTGDLEAYRLVRNHFSYLKQAVHNHGGAVVKTMGDAIMATFHEPAHSVAAALEMMALMQRYTQEIHPEELGLKIGIHTGPALTVNAGGVLDYFGRTVNIAARLQGLAQSGEICITQVIHSLHDIPDQFEKAGYRGETETVSLKGITGSRPITRYGKP
ncbi:adenylate/guanylate cyclase domain-containing protein [Magnetococcus sp. PR-3]|uniref:adenylate/guanylate cyclase domain-containing protein n=1 Tax=Magnetococcus sp. PR-3 TaxID=3120355 RepID=UPI002FCE0139